MATIQEIMDAGFLKFNKYKSNYDYNEIYTTEKSFLLSMKTVGLKWKRQGVFSGEDVDTICTQGLSVEEYEDYTTYGRPCLLVDLYGSLSGAIIRDDLNGATSFNNVGANITLYGANINGNVTRIDGVSFPDYGELTDSYSGENETIKNIVRNSNGGRLGYGSTIVPNNTAWLDLYGKKAIYSTNVPIFFNIEDVEEYIRTGNTENAINKESEEEEDIIDNKVYYYDYRHSSIDEKEKRLYDTIQNTARFKLKNVGNKVRFVWTNEEKTRAELVFNCDSVLLDNGNDFVDTSVSALIKDVIIGTIGSDFGDLDTNIPFVYNFDDDIEDNNTDAGDDNYSGKNGVMDNPSLAGITSPFGCYYLSENELQTVKNWIYTTDENAIEILKNGLWQYNDSPINCVIDVAYIPFNISGYCSMISRHLQFGSLVFDGHVDEIPSISFAHVSKSWGKVVHINEKIVPTYNDFRDYDTIKYSLYLPYYGILELDNSVVGKVLRVVSYFNVWTSTLKYYVYVANCLVGSYSCEVGQHVSLMGNDWLNKSKQNVQSTRNAISSALDVGKSALTLNPVGTWNAGTDFINDTMNILSKPQSMVNGVNSGGNNIYDDQNFYLIVENYETIKPTNLYTEYGIPTYTISNMSSCKGFTQIKDIKLNTYATDEERNEIINLLRSGVII